VIFILVEGTQQLVAALVLSSGLAAVGAGAADVGGPAPAWTLEAVLNQPGWQVGSVAYARDGKRLVVGGTGGHVRMYAQPRSSPAAL
jgi:hypothetical protein